MGQVEIKLQNKLEEKKKLKVCGIIASWTSVCLQQGVIWSISS